MIEMLRTHKVDNVMEDSILPGFDCIFSIPERRWWKQV